MFHRRYQRVDARRRSDERRALACRSGLMRCVLVSAIITCTSSFAGAATTDSPAIRSTATEASTPTPLSDHGTFRYDAEYPVVAYAETPSQNAIARLQQRLQRGEVQLKYEPPRGYLDSVLAVLDIAPGSQTLVYSKTSLQYNLISSRTPRAVYFNDDTYIAWIPATRFLEIATMDSALGPVFYTLSNVSPTELRIDRETSRCLTCHDTWGMAGGGVPRFLFLSTLVEATGESLSGHPGDDTTDHTPIRDRWAGWYVTGQHGRQQHLGNILAEAGTDLSQVDSLRRGNIDTVSGLFDAGAYLTKTSDIVALLIFEHQSYIENLVTRANFKSRTLLAGTQRAGGSSPGWASLAPDVRKRMKGMLEPLVQAMLFVNATALTDTITSTSGYDKWFQARGPRDSRGRSLRDFDLRTRLFKYPLSYVVYSEGFDGLPAEAREYVYMRLADILTGRDQSATFSFISADQRRTLLEILTATKPPFAASARQRSAECEQGDCDNT
jgi:hypothetical protein